MLIINPIHCCGQQSKAYTDVKVGSERIAQYSLVRATAAYTAHVYVNICSRRHEGYVGNMKVILAGMPKTGTKTMTYALRELGYTVYDVMEHYQHHRKEWTAILTGGAGADLTEIRRMYENVDAVADLPACGLWQEILRAFPDSKVNENEDFYFAWMLLLQN